MRPETIEVIHRILQMEVSEKKDVMMRAIESGIGKVGVEQAIEAYRSVYRALDDFEDWMDEQEDGS